MLPATSSALAAFLRTSTSLEDVRSVLSEIPAASLPRLLNGADDALPSTALTAALLSPCASPALLRLLLEVGGDPNSRGGSDDASFLTPLQAAAMLARAPLLRVLLEAAGARGVRDVQVYLERAGTGRLSEPEGAAAMALLKAVGATDPPGAPLLWQAAEHVDGEVLRRAVEEGAPASVVRGLLARASPRAVAAAMPWACRAARDASSAQVLAEFVAAGGDPNTPDALGRACGVAALDHASAPAMRAVLGAGLSVTAVQRYLVSGKDVTALVRGEPAAVLREAGVLPVPEALRPEAEVLWSSPARAAAFAALFSSGRGAQP